ncbi:glycosyltransferase family 4 protein [Thiobacillus sedimenti]|uniref:Glycosyltransferase family 4 protein n=1 Tax=Thiobacillus sedimenti TaxID=3110231 RepID=A0ABZ1CGV2_9PROT|nr:glycosyltransferase family 4 protein [Thiobacillus sp. SCUT-2]WRS38330.1 glycosyltransferase family 4 protein [Thiobacillus sp. SCUT-2]
MEELFVRQMQAHGVEVMWSMRRDRAGPCLQTGYGGQEVHLPLRLPVAGGAGKAVNRIAQYVCEVGLFLSLLFGKRFDIVQVRDRRYLFAFLGWVAARLRGSRFVFWSSYPFPEHLIEMAAGRRGPGRVVYWLRGRLSWFYLYRFVMAVADHVFVQSEQMLRDVARYGVPVAKMTPVPMGVPPHLLDWVATHAGEGVQSGKVVYVGTLARVRRMDQIIEAFRLVRQRNARAHLFMVGAGDSPAERAELEALTQRLGLTDAVTFTGFVPMEEAWRHAASAEVCVSPIYPSPVLNAGSPTKLVEYMALGRPLVANDHPEQAAILAESGAGLCVPWGVESFADAICELLENPEKARAMGSRGPAWVAANRTYDKLAAQVHARYLELLGGEA